MSRGTTPSPTQPRRLRSRRAIALAARTLVAAGCSAASAQTAPAEPWPFSVRPAGADPASEWRGQLYNVDFNGHRNDVAYLGWNVDPGGAPADPSQPAWHLGFEHQYRPSAESDAIWQEMYAEWRDGSGLQRRPWFLVVDQTTGDVTILMQTENGLALQDYDDDSWGNIAPGVLRITGDGQTDATFEGDDSVVLTMSSADNGSYEVQDSAPGQWVHRVDGQPVMRIAGDSLSVGEARRFGGTLTAETPEGDRHSRPTYQAWFHGDQSAPLFQARESDSGAYTFQLMPDGSFNHPADPAPTITGSRSDDTEAILGELLELLDRRGLIVDRTTP